MKKLFFLVFSFNLLLSPAVSHAQTETPQLNTRRDTLSWALGESQARACLQNSMALDPETIIRAFVHTMQGLQQPLDEESYQMALDYIRYTDFKNNQRIVAEKQEEARRLEKAYFAELIQTHPNVRYCPAGFFYEVLQVGKGDSAQANQRVTFDYRGYNMLTGELLDQTYGSSGPITVALNEGIFAGLRIGLKMMQAGATYRFYFPNEMVFGAKGSRVIPPYTSMIYEVELHQIHLD